MQLQRNGLTFSVDDAEVSRLVLERFNGIDAHLVSAATVPPAIGAQWNAQGGIYAGVMRGRDGGRDYHLIVGEAAEDTLTWDAAMAWAAGLKQHGFSDYTLPWRKEQALCFANVPELFQPEWYWSCEQHASLSYYAWVQLFRNGLQLGWSKGNNARARAVRRLTLQ